MREADLRRTLLNNVYMSRADLSYAYCHYTIFASVDLSVVVGLDDVNHEGPSNIDIRTLYRSKGVISEKFLRGCGVPTEFIEHTRGLFKRQFYEPFISYSRDDRDFARHLYDRLYSEGINCWMDDHNILPGRFFEDEINTALRVRERVIVCCSKSSLTSDWVRHEVNLAIQQEKAANATRAVRESHLIPLDLDRYLFDPTCDSFLASQLKKPHVVDFTNWKDDNQFEAGVEKIILALRRP